MEDRPKLLMLSHCVPDALGDVERARAWQLLRITAQTHQTHLVCLQDGRVNLHQWSAIDRIASRMSLEPCPWNGRITGAMAAILDHPAASRALMARSLHATLTQWRDDTRFDAVLCTHPGLWGMALGIPDARRVCDLQSPLSLVHEHQAHDPARRGWVHSLTRRWHQHQAQLYRGMERRIIDQADTITVSAAWHRVADASAQANILLLPDGIDLSYFHADSDARAARLHGEALPQVVFHADWRTTSHRLMDWFTREVWPAVRVAVPEATLASTRWPLGRTGRKRGNFEPLDPVRDAAVVISLSGDPQRAKWPVLQAMAMGRPVIAPEQAMDGTGARHGEHLLLSHTRRDWIEGCIESLRSLRMRQRLATGARAFIENHCPLERTGRDLVHALQQRLVLATQPPLARAA